MKKIVPAAGFRPFPILHVLGVVANLIQKVERTNATAGGKLKREQVKALFMESLSNVGTGISVETVKSKQFDSALNKIMDGVVAILNIGEQP